MTSAPPSRKGAAAKTGGHGQERRLGQTQLTNDLLSVRFEISPRRAGNDIAEGDARRVQMARRVTAARLRYCGLESLVDDATLIVSELVTNAVQHSGGTQITFTLTVDGGFLRISVHDEMPGRPVVRNTGDDAERGRGLFLVQCLSAAHGGTWGTSDDGATTWCHLALPDGRP
ncbi:ATP-binding protein [Streptomyces prasinus]|uniref:ATP-binding protein n=1 Tax=Streptomyces prasinus TaxID=67345 RepID=UPI00331B7CE3